MKLSNWIAHILAVLILGVGAVLIWQAAIDVPHIAIAVAALSTFFAAVSAVASLLQAVELQKQAEQQGRPYILGNFEGANSGVIYFVIKNFGNTAAKNVRVQFDPPPIDFSGRSLNDVSMFSSPIAFFPPGKDYRQLIDTGPNLLAEGKPLQFRLDIEYQSVKGVKYKENTDFDLAYLRQATNPQRTVEEYLKDIVEVLKER